MTLYNVYYQKTPQFRPTAPETVAEFHDKYVFLKSVEAEDLEGVFTQMQAENWSPNGEARGLIRARKLAHTSMSVGDIVEDIEQKSLHLCDSTGWKSFELAGAEDPVMAKKRTRAL